MPSLNASENEAVVETINPNGRGDVVLLCEHASNFIPDEFQGLGLSDEDRISHAAWDPGAFELAKILSEKLDSPLVASKISRLVYDCNRAPDEQSAMSVRSELIDVPGNVNLSLDAKQHRVDTVYLPFCETVEALVTRRTRQGFKSFIVTIHSFTPIYYGQNRQTEIGILHDIDSRMADVMLANSDAIAPRRVDRNMPYGPNDNVTHSLKIHGIENRLANVMIEVRNDLLASQQDIKTIADELIKLLLPAIANTKMPKGEIR